MRRTRASLVAALALAGLAGPAAAEYMDETPPKPVATKEFWRDVIDPNALEVEALLQKAQQAVATAEQSRAMDLDLAAQETRAKMFGDLLNMMVYARKLSPQNTDVLVMLGRCADELGKTSQAIEAFRAVAQIKGREKVPPEVAGNLGTIYLRMGQLDDAIAWLRIAHAVPDSPTDYRRGRYNYRWNRQHTVVYLATALALHDQAAIGLEILQAEYNPKVASYYGTTLAPFALAVHLDRDDQRSAAFEVLERMQQTYSTSFAGQLQNELAMFQFVPGEDRHYFQALLYETMGAYIEARAEWLTYANTGAPHRARALEHVAMIDAQRRSPTSRAPGVLPVPPAYPYPRPIRTTP